MRFSNAFKYKSTADAVHAVWGDNFQRKLDNSRVREMTCFGHLVTECRHLGHDVDTHLKVFRHRKRR